MLLVARSATAAPTPAAPTRQPPAPATSLPPTAQPTPVPSEPPTVVAAPPPAQSPSTASKPGKLGVHLLLEDLRQHWQRTLWPEHMRYARDLVGEWGFVIALVRLDDLDTDKW